MQEVVITAPRRVALRTVDEEPMTPDSIRVRSLYSGISHGTEMSFYQATAPHFDHEIDEGLFRKRNDGTSFYPVRHGYEMVGEVIEVGSRVEGFEIGDIAWTGTAGHADTFVCDTTVDGRPCRPCALMPVAMVVLTGWVGVPALVVRWAVGRGH